MYSNNLSKKLTPAPLTGVITYRLLAAGMVDPRQSTRTMCPLQFLKGEEMIYDPGDKTGDGREKVLRYVIGSKPMGEGPLAQIVPELGEPEFKNGIIEVKPGQLGLYEFLERSNFNISNPFRKEGTRAIFERVDHLAKAQAANEDDELLEDALFALRDLSDERKLEFAAAKTLARADDSMVLVVRALRTYVKANPAKFLRELDSPELKARAVIAQALEYDVIQYVPTDHAYKWKNEGVMLYQVPQGFDGKTKLMEYLLSADAVPTAQLKELTKQVAAATKGK